MIVALAAIMPGIFVVVAMVIAVIVTLARRDHAAQSKAD
jgi:hypothetical protein